MSELKNCPFCGLRLEHIVSSYKNRNGNEVTEDYFQHPLNDCILSTIPSEGFRIGNCGKDIIDWNTRQPRFTAEEREAIKNVCDCATSYVYYVDNGKSDFAKKRFSAIATVHKMMQEDANGHI